MKAYENLFKVRPIHNGTDAMVQHPYHHVNAITDRDR